MIEKTETSFVNYYDKNEAVSYTHRWLSFYFDASILSSRVWMLLGEAQSKCRHIAFVPLKPEMMTEMTETHLMQGALASVAIEGNSLSSEDAAAIMRGDDSIPPSKAYQKRELENLRDLLRSVAAQRDGALCPDWFVEQNKALLAGAPNVAEVAPGVIGVQRSRHARSQTTIRMQVGDYIAPPPEASAGLLDDLCAWLTGEAFAPDAEQNAVAWAILKALYAHLYFVWIHPFGDGNGRLARLLEVKILRASGVNPLCLHLLSNHYNTTRTEYYRHLSRARQGDEGLCGFIEYAVQGFVDGLRQHVDQAMGHVHIVTWKNHVYEAFRERKTPPEKRRRLLLLSLPFRLDGVAIADIPRLNGDLFRLYRQASPRTLSRDITALEKRGFLVRQEGGSVRLAIGRILVDMPHFFPHFAKWA